MYWLGCPWGFLVLMLAAIKKIQIRTLPAGRNRTRLRGDAGEMSELSEARMMRIVDELAEAAQRVGLEVRREKIMREIGYRTRGGACRLRDKNLVIIDRHQPAPAQLEAIAEALP